MADIPEWATGDKTPSVAAPSWAAPDEGQASPPATPQWAEKTPAPAEKPTFFHRVLGNLAAASDFVLSIPGMATKAISEQEASVEILFDRMGKPAPESPELEIFKAELKSSQGGINLETGMTPQKAFNDYYNATANKIAYEARQTAERRTPEWLLSPAEFAMKKAGLEQAYKQSVPSEVMGWVSKKLVSLATNKEGVTNYVFLNYADAVMAFGGMKLPFWLKDRMLSPTASNVMSRIRSAASKPKAPSMEEQVSSRLAGAKPTGVEPPRVVTDAEAAAVVDKLAKEQHPSTPVERPEIKAAKRNRLYMKEGEYISSPDEGDLTDWQAAHAAHKTEIREMEPVHDMPRFGSPWDMPPIDSYEGALPSADEAISGIKSAMDVPEINSPDPAISETAKDLASERVKSTVQPNAAFKPVSIGIYLERTEGTVNRAAPDVEDKFAAQKSTLQNRLKFAEGILVDAKASAEEKTYALETIYDVKKQLKGLGMRLSAERRKATGNLTAKEQRAAIEREKTNYVGKNVTVDGSPGKIIGHAWGRVKVRMEDGNERTVTPDEIKSELTTAPDVSRETAQGLKDAGFQIDTSVPDGGVAQVKKMLEDEQQGKPHYKQAEMDKPPQDEWVNSSSEAGSISTKLLIPMGITATGAVIGAAYNPDNPLAGVFEGALGGFALANFGRAAADSGVGTKMGEVWSAVKPSIDPVRAAAAKVMYGRTANIKVGLWHAGALQRAMMNAIPAHRLEEITLLVEGGKLDSLSPVERYYVDQVQKFYNDIGIQAQEVGVIPRLITKNYVPHAWDLKDASTKKFFDEGGFDRLATNSFTKHGLRRGVEGYLAGLQYGLKPKTLNYGHLLGIYANSVVRALHNAEAIYTLKTTDIGGGLHMVEPITGKLPLHFVRNHGIEGLEGHAIHEEAVKPLQRAMESHDPGVIERSLLSVAFGAKRLAISYSGFHPASLTLAYTGAGGNPVSFALGAAARGIEKISGQRIKIPYKSAIDNALDQYRSVGGNEIIEWGLRNGLELRSPIEDTVGKAGFEKFRHLMDRTIGADIHGLEPFRVADEQFHHFIWDYTQTGMKLDIFQKTFSKMAVNPKYAHVDLNEIARDAASYTNNLFGSLDWQGVIERQRTPMGRALAGAAYSKRGLNYAQIVSFAPDWMISTLRSWTQAIPGLSENARVGRLHRAYLARSLLYTLAMSDAVNLTLSGHHIWQNDFRSERKKQQEGEQTYGQMLHDMTYIDMGDGRKMAANKHLYEFIHAITDPGNFLAYKASSIVTDPINILSNRQWASFDFAPPITTSKNPVQRVYDVSKWMLLHHAPISLQQAWRGNFSGTFGLPVTGLSHEERQKIRAEERGKK